MCVCNRSILLVCVGVCMVEMGLVGVVCGAEDRVPEAENWRVSNLRIYI